MKAVEIIAKKRDGESLSEAEIHWFVNHYTKGMIPDYQASAFLMATYLKGMDENETIALTDAMIQSGEQLDLSYLNHYIVDKHSSGGVGDKTTLVVVPIVASAGLPVAKMSGRGLGFTGGTLDKLESIPGMTTRLTYQHFIEQVQTKGLAIVGQTTALAPADGKFYALRDVTATIESLPLIASSIMSKKLASGANGIVLDVKVGNGSFLGSLGQARKLAQMMVMIGSRLGRDVTALLADMSQPLGKAIGNILEVKEAIATLHNKGADDFTEHCLILAAHMLLLGQKADNLTDAYQLAEERLYSEAAWEAFLSMIDAQGGDLSYLYHPSKFLRAPIIRSVQAVQSGTVAALNAREVGLTVMELGGGRAKKEDLIDPTVGVILHAKIGHEIRRGDTLFELHTKNESQFLAARKRLLQAFEWSDDAVIQPPLFYETISSAQ